MSAGELRNPVRLQARGKSAAAKYGQAAGAWEDKLPPGAGGSPGKVWAKVRARSAGGETTTAARLEGRQPFEILLRADPITLEIAADWRIVSEDQEPRGFFNVKSAAPAPFDSNYVLVLAERGGPNG